MLGGLDIEAEELMPEIRFEWNEVTFVILTVSTPESSFIFKSIPGLEQWFAK
jgi:hypothetical protein